MFRRHPNKNDTPRRSGTTVVEVAVTLPVFCVLIVGMMECCHALMVIQTLDSSAREAARYGAVDGITSAQVTTRAKSIMSSTTRIVPTVLIKDASCFDDPNFNPSTINYASLNDKELSSAEDDEMFIVRMTLPYNDVALLPPFWVKNITLSGQAVMRHE